MLISVDFFLTYLDCHLMLVGKQKGKQKKVNAESLFEVKRDTNTSLLNLYYLLITAV